MSGSSTFTGRIIFCRGFCKSMMERDFRNYYNEKMVSSVWRYPVPFKASNGISVSVSCSAFISLSRWKSYKRQRMRHKHVSLPRKNSLDSAMKSRPVSPIFGAIITGDSEQRCRQNIQRLLRDGFRLNSITCIELCFRFIIDIAEDDGKW